MQLQIGQIYQHYETKGLYRVTDIGIHTETGEKLVAYKSLDDGRTFFRPLDIFTALAIPYESEEPAIPRFTIVRHLKPDYVEAAVRQYSEMAKEMGRQMERLLSTLPS